MESDEWKMRLLLVSIILGTTGINQGINKLFPEARSDPFTGSDWRNGKSELIGEIDKLREDYERYQKIDEERVHILEQRLISLKERLEALHGQ